MNIKEFLTQCYRRGRHLLANVRLNLRPRAELTLSGEKRVIVLGSPNHGNLGDSAIAFAEEEFLKKTLPGYSIFFVDETEYTKYRHSLKKQITEQDVIVLQGGGNMGSLYPYAEDLRRATIKAFPKNKKIIFPQTIYFFANAWGEYDKRKMKQLYNRDKNLYFFAREEYSYELMREMFDEERVFLVPDIVLSMTELLPTDVERRGALCCFRSDVEAKLTAADRENIYNKVSGMYDRAEFTDTVIPNYDGFEESRGEVRRKLAQFAGAELVVTDRLHGMVFAAITKTPCVAMSNYNKKVLGVYKWISKLSYVKYIDDIAELDAAIDCVIKAEKNDGTVFGDLISKYAPLVDVLTN